ncbi:MAG: glycosyltransferase [Chitinophagaceae bacterium]|nr:MAG: glycosyltransferase [Chitinophagaceae bacterium]
MTSHPHVIFLSYDGMTDPLGQSQVIPYLVGLTAYGYRFTIISCEKVERFSLHREDVVRQLDGHEIEWHPLRYHKRPPVLSAVYDLVAMKRAMGKLYAKDPFQLVHARTGLPSIAALWMKKKYGTAFLNDIRGFWADERVDGEMWNLKNPVFKSTYRFFKRTERHSIQVADYNNCLTQAAKTEILNWKDIPGQPRPISVIPCSVDLELFNPLAVDEDRTDALRKEFKITKDQLVVSYLGSVGGWYMTNEMMRFNKLLAEKVPDAVFLFISPDRHEVILESARAAGIKPDQVRVISARRKQVPAFLSLSAYSIFFIKPCYSKIASSPTKHAEIMAMGIPVITNDGVGDVREIVEKNEGGYVLKDFSDDSFNQIIAQIQSGAKFSPEKIRKAAIEIYSLESAVKTYAGVYQKILRSRSHDDPQNGL